MTKSQTANRQSGFTTAEMGVYPMIVVTLMGVAFGFLPALFKARSSSTIIGTTLDCDPLGAPRGLWVVYDCDPLGSPWVCCVYVLDCDPLGP